MNPPRKTRGCRLVAFGLALVFAIFPAHADTKRVGIVYSETSKQAYFDEFSYYQLYMGMQYQCAMAGIPYDLLDEDDLTNAATLANYDALVVPFLENVTAAKRAQILPALTTATANGLSLVTGGWFLAFDENGNDHSDFIQVLDTLVGVEAVIFHGPVSADLLVRDATHPAMPGYTAGELLRKYPQIWTSIWQPSPSVDGSASSTLADLKIGGVNKPAIHALTMQDGRRNVHFSNEQLMQDCNILWSSLQWALYGSDNPVALRLGRQRSIFFARNDMDQSQFAEEVPLVHVPLLNIIDEWKAQHDFVGSFYLNIGNNQSQGEFTNWNFSGPLYQQYRALGNEIGTHSYTHPDNTALLNATQLEFEFNQSVLNIEQNMGIQVPGAAVPGLPENPFVIETVAPWLDYLSGRAALADTTFGFASAFGRIKPGFDMFYFCLNTSPDFTLLDYLGLTPAQAEAVWMQEYATQHDNAPLPVIHWLWHDYGPTGFEPGYVRGPFDTMVSTAAAGGSEFVTGVDLKNRITSLRAANLDVTTVDADTFTVQVGSADAGRFSLALREGQTVASVNNWYAYNGNKVFLPKNGGTFTINTGITPVPATRITSMPARSELLTLSGNGVTLDFTFVGEGDLMLELHQPGFPLQVSGADSIQQNGSSLMLTFNSNGTHAVSVTESLGNQAPEANSLVVTTAQGQPVSFVLDASDPEGNPLQYTIIPPANGTLQGVAPNFTYLPDTGFSGNDQLTFTVSDGLASSDPAQVFITVTETAIVVDGVLNDWSALSPLVNDPADTPDTVDILQLYALVDSGNLYLGMQNEGSIVGLTYGYTWYLDTDLESSTGFGMFAIGADYVIQGSKLYQHTGASQSSWTWTFVADATAAVSGSSAELRFPTSLIGGVTGFEMIFWGNNSAFGGGSIDVVPNAGFVRFNSSPTGGPNPIAIDGDFSDWPADPYILVDGDDLAGVNAVDILEVQMATQDNNLYIGYTNESVLPALDWTYTMYIDSDLDPATGFLSGNLGGDYMIQEAVLYQYAGTGADWIWTTAANLLVALNGNLVELEVPLAGLGSPGQINFEVVGENAALSAPGGVDIALGQFDLGLTGNLALPFSRRALQPVIVTTGKEARATPEEVRLPSAREMIDAAIRNKNR